MKQVTTETIRERINELGRHISHGQISLIEEFELASLYKLLGFMEQRTVTIPVTLPPTLWCQFDDSPQHIAVLEKRLVLSALTDAGINWRAP
ncbi:hypothetical protein HV207_23085 [Klebsiella pneumoniae]|uniref:hypothetical protein n=1 Tax=Klebsiella pneumoniae TaxID=573 RepID=UPI0015E53E8C|nr:hypothetical protein [Klebsiella pneumoniae]QLO29592.1 hypothetical protein HV207_05325 [Klebsiella pneumoniae]QLO31069.1 hypothetical protein HV207_13575 [Klebsiella pneumoniae]QLO32795.1 hypothetical protein HV207_23085 [Klebsiella pneumoniae]QLT37774.1 hypothetical protein HV292_05565 [Klebsiella pneumoniae]QLT39254.1 hypothetical protein HV292_13825 [Klebsiella pneumoniae]